jgi:hypothetical protein
MFRAWAIACLFVLLVIVVLAQDAKERRRLELGCASEGMTLVETNAGYRCEDDRGDLFLPPFKPEKKR